MHAWLGLGHSEQHACLACLCCSLHRAQHLPACMPQRIMERTAAVQPAWIDGWMHCRRVCVCVYTAVKEAGAGANDSGGRMHACCMLHGIDQAQAWHDLPAGCCCCLLLQLQRRAGSREGREQGMETLRRAEFEADARNSASSGSRSMPLYYLQTPVACN